MRHSGIGNHHAAMLAATAVAAGALAWYAVACRDPVGPGFPADAKPLEPLAPYRTWWALVEECSGLRGDFDRVQWYTSERIALEDGGHCGGWSPDGNRIVLAPDHVSNGGTVRHEMLHALTGHLGHSADYFITRCGALTPCERECGVTESSRGVPADAKNVQPEYLHVSVRIDPTSPRRYLDDGWFRITITARNPTATPVWVWLPGLVSYSYHEVSRGGNGTLTREARWGFLANEARSFVFDEVYPAGTYTLHGAFGGARSLPLTFTVTR